MFTGLVEAVGTLSAVVQAGGGAQVSVAVRWPGEDAATRLGDSVAVNGACLTVIRIAAQDGSETLTFDLSHETLSLTTFAQAVVGQRVNLERALLVGDRLGGHIVTGHVDGVGHLAKKTPHPAGWDLVYALPLPLLPEVVKKGSICLDGVSLTVNHVGGELPMDCIGVTIVPHTGQNTQLLDGVVGKLVHVETDIFAKHIRRLTEFSRQNA